MRHSMTSIILFSSIALLVSTLLETRLHAGEKGPLGQSTTQIVLWGLSSVNEVINAISKEKAVGPYFFENGNMNRENYRNMLVHYAFPRSASLRDDYIFHQDGAPAHNSHSVRRCLGYKRTENWIGRGGPVEWPAR